MLKRKTNEPTRQKPFRLWPGVVIVVLQWLLGFGLPVVASGIIAGYIGAFGRLFGGLAVIVWWAFFSRAPRSERWGAVVLMIVAMTATSRIIHESIATGNIGMMFFLYAIPFLSLAFVAWAVASRHLVEGPRRATMVATILLACGVWTLLRSDGITGTGAAQFTWRWAETPEERLLARYGDEPMAPAPISPAAETKADWPGFRGRNRDGVIHGVRVETDWFASPPIELWRRPIGPGCSSFAVRGDLLYTQEQRGDDEVVACYKASTGEPVWNHRDKARYWDSHAGAGPRATPTLSPARRRVYTFGATGIVNALDAGDGSLVWSRNAASDTQVKLPSASAWYGFSSSPLVVDDLVIVAASGTLVAYDRETGAPRWIGPTSGESYSSPHLLTIDGIAQILLLSGVGATSVAPADGRLLWMHSWQAGGRIVQPALTAEGDVLIGSGLMRGIGMRRIAVTHEPGEWTTDERWTSNRLKPYFNDFVVHEGHAFGFDGRILACIDLEDGSRKWKGGRYGTGQLVLLAEQDLLLVLSEKGELALVRANSDQFTELAHFPALEGKTWNHPALVGDLLLVRNAQEMAAFRLSLAGG
ncbi:MAG: PQQ-binding-like beta-propeller repeat protein [bacterium]